MEVENSRQEKVRKVEKRREHEKEEKCEGVKKNIKIEE